MSAHTEATSSIKRCAVVFIVTVLKFSNQKPVTSALFSNNPFPPPSVGGHGTPSSPASQPLATTFDSPCFPRGVFPLSLHCQEPVGASKNSAEVMVPRVEVVVPSTEVMVLTGRGELDLGTQRGPSAPAVSTEVTSAPNHPMLSAPGLGGIVPRPLHTGCVKTPSPGLHVGRFSCGLSLSPAA